MRPAVSRTVATIAWGPSATREESQGSVTWLPKSVAVAIVVPPIDSVKVRLAAGPSTQMSDHTTPPTVAPADGW